MKFHSILIATFAAIFTAGHAYAICAENTDVFSTVAQNGPDFTYDFSVFNGCVGFSNQPQPLLEAFFLPYFSDAGITDIVVPSGWSYSIDTGDDLFGLANAGVIEFDPPAPFGYDGFSGFSYISQYGGVDGPFAIERDTGTLFGDPQIPGSPETIAALAAATPEPSTTALLALGLCAIALAAKRRRTSLHSARV